MMDESRYLSNYGLSQRPKGNYVDEVEEDEEQQEGDFIHHNGDDVNNNDEDDDSDEDDVDGKNHSRNDSFRHPKKRRLKSLLSSFEFPPPQSSTQTIVTTSTSKSSFGGRNTLADWSEHETFVLLEAWGERFLQRGRKSLRSEEWQQVAEIVSHESKIERTDTQCRNRLDTLKKKYKKEKPLLSTKWVYFKKMDMLMSATPTQQDRLSCGVDSGEYVFMNPTGNTDSHEGDDDSDSKRLKIKGGRGRGNGGSFKLLADSINRFSEIYEKIEDGKRKQILELENMKMDFYEELELQKRQILDRARDEIVKIRQGDYEENNSTENISG